MSDVIARYPAVIPLQYVVERWNGSLAKWDAVVCVEDDAEADGIARDLHRDSRWYVRVREIDLNEDAGSAP